MKVLLLSDYGDPRGGSEIVTLMLRRGLRARGHDARLLTSNVVAGIGANQADYRCFGTASPLRAALWPANPSAYLVLRRVLAGFRPDVIHVRMFLSQLSPAILPLLRTVPTVYHEGWFRTICPTGRKVFPDGTACHVAPGRACYSNGCVPLLAWPLSMAQLGLWRRWRGVFDSVVTNSRFTADLLRESGLPPTDIVWNGIPRRPARPPLAAAPTVAFAGRLILDKGVDLLLTAFAELVRTAPDARLLIAGAGPERQALQGLARRLGLSDAQVRFLGHLARADLERQFDAAWVQAVPTPWMEAFGNAAAEAMMRGTAVVVSAIGGLPEFVEHGRTGLVVPPRDPAALRDALLRYLLDRDLAERTGQAARAFAVQAFDEDTFIDRFVGIYEQLVAAGKSAPGAAITAPA